MKMLKIDRPDTLMLVLAFFSFAIAAAAFVGLATRNSAASTAFRDGDLETYTEEQDGAKILAPVTYLTAGIGSLLLVGGLIARASSSSANVTPGSLVRVRRQVQLLDGTIIPEEHASMVTALDIIDGVPVAEIKGPAGGSHWVAKANLRVD